MATFTPSGFALAQRYTTVNQYYVPASDTNTYAVGDTVATTGAIFAGTLPDGRPTQGMLHITRAVSGGRIRGVVVGILVARLGAEEMIVPATKSYPYVLLVNDNPLTVYSIQADNTEQLREATGLYANYTIASPSGSVSGTRLATASLNPNNGDMLVQSAVQNGGAFSTFNVVLMRHEAFDSGCPAVHREEISGDVSLDLSLLGTNVLHLTLIGNVTSFALTGLADGRSYFIRFYQDATGSRTFAGFPAAYKFAGGTAPTFSTAANAFDILSLEWGETEATAACSFLAGMA